MAKEKVKQEKAARKRADQVAGRRAIDTSKIDMRRARSRIEEEGDPPPPNLPQVSAGPVDKVIELAFNPSREKLREVTIIDRMQGRLFPIVDTMNAMFMQCIKISTFRQSQVLYKQQFQEDHPAIVVDVLGEWLYRTAQWQKSVAGKNLERATDIALAEMETRGTEDENERFGLGRSGYED